MTADTAPGRAGHRPGGRGGGAGTRRERRPLRLLRRPHRARRTGGGARRRSGGRRDLRHLEPRQPGAPLPAGEPDQDAAFEERRDDGRRRHCETPVAAGRYRPGPAERGLVDGRRARSRARDGRADRRLARGAGVPGAGAEPTPGTAPTSSTGSTSRTTR